MKKKSGKEIKGKVERERDRDQDRDTERDRDMTKRLEICLLKSFKLFGRCEYSPSILAKLRQHNR